MSHKPFLVLVVEDNVPDIELVKFLFQKSDVPIKLAFVSDGIEATDFLFRRNKYKDASRPNLILVDLNIPKKDGREILMDLGKDRELSTIPVIVLSTSTSQSEISEVYRLGASAFISKPPDLERYEKIIHSLVDFWFKSVSLPGE
jgi:two-component system, chemotaxis family, response regulator Rcp1